MARRILAVALVGVGYDHVEFLANIGMFVPLGVLSALLVPKRVWWTLLVIGTAFSGFIETYQTLFLPGRYARFLRAESVPVRGCPSPPCQRLPLKVTSG